MCRYIRLILNLSGKSTVQLFYFNFSLVYYLSKLTQETTIMEIQLIVDLKIH